MNQLIWEVIVYFMLGAAYVTVTYLFDNPYPRLKKLFHEREVVNFKNPLLVWGVVNFIGWPIGLILSTVRRLRG